MKRFLLPFLSMGFAAAGYAQTQLPNVGFENWTNVGQNTEEPTNMNSNKTGGGFAGAGPQTCFRNSSPYAGSYCVELRTISSFGTPVNGTATTGKVQAPTFTPSDGYIETVRADPDFSWPFVGQPDSLVGYYKYLVAGNDQGKVQVYLHGDYDVRNPQNAASMPYVYAEAKFLTPHADVPAWTRFSVPFTYASNTTPMYALLVCTASSESATAVDGSKMWLDDVQVVYNATGTEDALQARIPAHWAGDDLVIDLSRSGFSEATAMQLFDLSGKLELENALEVNGMERISTQLAAGVYLLRVVSGDRSYAVKLAKLR